MRKETFKKTVIAVLAAALISDGIVSVKATQVNASTNSQTLKKLDAAISPKVPKAVLDKVDNVMNKTEAKTQYSIAEAKRTAVLRGKKSVRFVTINKKGKIVKTSRKAKPGVKYHVNRMFKMGKRNYVEIKLGRKYVLLNAKYVKFI